MDKKPMQTQPDLELSSSQDVVAGVSNSGMVPSDFLTLFPEFGDAAKFPLQTIALWLKLARSFVDEGRWGASFNLGVGLFVAHQLSTGAQAALAVQSGAAPSVGVISSKSVGPLSKSYDTSTGGYDDAGFWNTTPYGRQYWAFVSLFGAGGAQL